MQPKTRQWVDPFGIWHRDNSSALGFSDGHVEMHRFYSRGLIEWNLKALHEPMGWPACSPLHCGILRYKRPGKRTFGA